MLHRLLAMTFLFAALPAQQAAGVLPCCSTGHDVELPPLPADATARERWLRRIHDGSADDASNVFLSRRYIADMQQRLATLREDAPLAERFGLHWGLAQALVRTGELDEAIAMGERCVRLCEQNPAVASGWLPEVLLRVGATHFRLAEKQNCIARHNAESCILPLSAAAVHVEKQGAAAAAAVLTRLLALEQSDLRLEATWLLNIAHQALGDWPEGVPEAHRLPASVFASEAPFPRMRECSGAIGLGKHAHAGSVVIDDFTGDGQLDLLTCAFDTGRPPRLLRHDGDGQWPDVAVEAGLARQLGGVNLVHADVDNDGLLDVLVLRGGGFFAGSEFPLSLLRQDRAGHFVDFTDDAGLALAGPIRTATFGDIDHDGDLDLFLGFESERTQAGVKFPSLLFLNDGKGHFTDVTGSSGVANTDRVVGALFADFDGDGAADLYVSNFLAPNRLFMNRGRGTFREEAKARGVDGPLASGPIAVLDFDNDGDLDLFVTWQHHYRQIRSVAAWYIEHRVEDDCQRLFANNGRGTFTDVTEAKGLRRVYLATGVNTGDVDNDGFPDLYVATGAHDLAALFPNVLLLGGERFRDVTFAAGVGHLQKGNGVSFADLDGDGDLEITAQVGGYFPDDSFGSVLFENPGNQNHWLEFELVGKTDNRFGIGARVRAHVAGADGERDVYATVGVGGSLGDNPYRAHLGLGRADRVVFVEVKWPAKGDRQRLDAVPMDAVLRIEQGGTSWERVERKRLRITKGG
ncbi:MAG TPA: CRTAC1 family protein [Planctomycetota bacterium]